MKVIIIPVILSLLISSVLLSQESITKNGFEEKKELSDFPATLEEAHSKLETFFSKEALEKMNAMETKHELFAFFIGAKDRIDTMCGLSRDSSLAKYLKSKGFINKEEMATAILESFWSKNKGKEVSIEKISADYKAYREENKWPDTSAVDPKDKSPIMWNTSLGAEGRLHRRIYLGESEKTGQLLAYEHTVGVYVPGEDLMKRLQEIENSILSSESELISNGASKQLEITDPARTKIQE